MNNELIFVHIPKSAGHSIIETFGKNDIKIVDHNIRNLNYKYLKDKIKDYKQNYFIFAFVRNPWDRVVSSFFYLINGGCNSKDKEDGIKYLIEYKGNFKLFVKNAFKNKKIFDQLHFKPQYKWICNKNKEVLVDFIGKFENLNEDINKISTIINIKFKELPHKNKSDHKFYKEYYDEETKEIIREVYNEDIELFNYEF